jgi:6-phosphogluconolactonase (cycloisomerase 2 family)
MKKLFSLVVLVCALAPAAAQAAASDASQGAVYTLTNSAAGNAVVAFARAEDGSLTRNGTYPTGGAGGALGSGHAIVVSSDGHTVAAVNAGSNSIAVFHADKGGLARIATVPSNGLRPTSITVHDDLVYVLNAGSLSIAGFRVSGADVVAVPGSVRPLGATAATPSQVQFTPDGGAVVVDSRGSSTFDSFLIGADGSAGPAVTTNAVAAAPFGFDFDRAGHLLTSNVNLGNGTSGASSYDVAGDGTLTPNGGGVISGQAAACWLAAAGAWAYTTNAGSGSIGRFAVSPSGALSLTGTTVIGAGAHPLDEDATKNQHELYVLVDGFHEIRGYRVERDGSLTQVAAAAVPVDAAGLAAY